jgi:hypothetical protein
MKKVSFVVAAMALVAVLFLGSAHADVPFINLEGVGGVAFNPLAYPAVTPPKKGEEGWKIGPVSVGKPRIGAWYVNLNDTDIDWFNAGIATTFANRLELSYGYQSVNLGSKLNALNTDLSGLSQNVHKSNIGAKLLLLEENSFGTSYLPAVSIGTVYKTTSFKVDKFGTTPKVDKDGFDAYLVATKLITQLPRPVLLSAGLLASRGQVNGILGFNEKYRETFFGNIDILPLDNLAIGFEYKQGPRFNSFKNEDYWNIHAAWLVNQNLTLIAAYANAGNRKSSTHVGLSDGPVISIQYSF